ncbi:DUF4082 domain-containing protein [Actinokineospora diospyrosa]|uniref:DUF4082 domain-containing protein n=1 Tax=Actinokineospora diospyrosa TaxID=103728 RepID=A0ABT1IHA9_9PSEU|nr:DUF4082 domain-containing protein [Actinokineospora diospyrosa]MCP2272030.1 protein of unknown function (DUF4082) [Actinokineospora diospyrosa]
MRRLVALIFAILLLTPGTATAESPRVWVDLPVDNALVPVDQSITLRGHSLGLPGDGVKYTEIALHDQNHFVIVAGAGQTDWEYTFTPTAPQVGPLVVFARVVLDSRQTTTAEVLNLRVGESQRPTAMCPCVFEPPGAGRLYNERTPLELGLRFFVDRPGSITGVQLAADLPWTEGLTAHLWSAKGSLLATTTEHGSYPRLNFATPVAVDPYAAYVVSYTSPNGVYYATSGYFTQRVGIPPIVAHYDNYEPFPHSAPGIFGAPGAFPRSTYNGGNYWVSPVFTS